MTTPNAELAYRVLDYVTAHPEQHDQSVYVSRLDATTPSGPLCGTVACFAGWTCILGGDVLEFTEDEGLVIRGSDLGVHERAEELLGLEVDGDQSFELFIETQRRDDLPGVVAEIFGPRPRTCCASTEDVGHDFTCPVMLGAAGVALDYDDVPPNAGSAS